MSEDIVRLTTDPLSVDAITKMVSHPSCGAVSIFAGLTRADSAPASSIDDSKEQVQVHHLDYEAYEEMAMKKMYTICESARVKWPTIRKIAIFHRLGTVAVEEASVVIAVSSPHRADSLESLPYIIDTLKAQVPIWKKEYFSDGTSTWKENCECLWREKKYPA